MMVTGLFLALGRRGGRRRGRLLSRLNGLDWLTVVMVTGLFLALRRAFTAGVLAMVHDGLAVSLQGRIDRNRFDFFKVNIENIPKGGLAELKLRLSLFNRLQVRLGELGSSRDLVMNIAILARMMAARVVVRVDHVLGSRADSRVNLLGGHRNVIRVERSLVVMRVTVVRVPMGLVSLVAAWSGLGGALGILVGQSLFTDKCQNQSDQNIRVHPTTIRIKARGGMTGSDITWTGATPLSSQKSRISLFGSTPIFGNPLIPRPIILVSFNKIQFNRSRNVGAWRGPLQACTGRKTGVQQRHQPHN